MLKTRCPIFACINIEENNRIRTSANDVDVEVGDNTKYRRSGTKP